VTIGARNFLGNHIAYPAQGRTGDNCLLATKVMVPLDGKIRENVGLLGSPCFEIPRSVQRDSRFDHLKQGDELRRRIAAKTRYNTVTMAFYLIVQWIQLAGLLLIGLAVGVLENRSGDFGKLTIAANLPVSLVYTVAFQVLVERAVMGFRAMRPRFCSIYEPYFWRHERFWKVSANTYLAAFNGTSIKNVIWRLLGVRIGRRVFDDGCGMPEKTLVTIGSDVTLNAGCTIQSHSLEDGTFKSDRISIGAGSTIGTHAFVHYGVNMAEGAVLAPDSFLMKGSDTAPGSSWWGNPATERSQTSPVGVTGIRPSSVTTTVDA
jgi:non-ribosomal peptide synthetase-like protein